MIETAKGIPDFNEQGNLPRKCYEVTLEEISLKRIFIKELFKTT